LEAADEAGIMVINQVGSPPLVIGDHSGEGFVQLPSLNSSPDISLAIAWDPQPSFFVLLLDATILVVADALKKFDVC